MLKSLLLHHIHIHHIISYAANNSKSLDPIHSIHYSLYLYYFFYWIPEKNPAFLSLRIGHPVKRTRRCPYLLELLNIRRNDFFYIFSISSRFFSLIII